MKKKNKYNKYQCHCCGYYTLNDGEEGTYNICKVCYWEDDKFQYNDPDYISGANKVSLNQARQNYKAFGAAEKEYLHYVFKPDMYEQAD